MTDPSKPREAVLVRSWLERRFEAARLDQATADRRGYETRDDFGDQPTGSATANGGQTSRCSRGNR